MTDREMQMYGCDMKAFKESVKDSISYQLAGGGMWVAGLMSDAQELMALGDTETARQYLNRAKSIMFEMMDAELTTNAISFFPERKQHENS
jgi:hypothetical protein